MLTKSELWPGGPLFTPSQSFPLGTDSVLLADFVRLGSVRNCFDIGCGAGAVSVLLLARSPGLRMSGIEISGKDAELARLNMEDNGWGNQVDIIHGDLREIRSCAAGGTFDAAVCNPPYFSAGSGKCAAGARGAARQQTECSLGDICAAASFLLKNGGCFYTAYRPEKLADLICLMRGCALEAKRLRFVHHSAEKPPSLVLTEARRSGAAGIQVMPPLLLTDSSGAFTAEYRRIYHMEAGDA